MTPRLVLLTGPAAGEVAGVFSWGCKPREVFQFVNDNIQQAQWWDEVRDYWEAPNVIAGLPDAVAVEHGIRSLPGGEAWLVGLVLPEPSRGPWCQQCYAYIGYCSHEGPFTVAQWAWCEDHGRVAILAPDPPALLVERVNAWGGEVWDCFSPSMGPEVGWAVIRQDKPGAVPGFPTWPEAVRAALGDPS